MNEETRAIKQEQKSIYAEQGDVYITYGNDRKIHKILSSPPSIPEVFLDRESDLKAIHEKLISGENPLLINGEGGIGKTAFAAKYLRCYQDEYHHLAWVFRGNNLLDALLSLAGELIEPNFPKTVRSKDRLEKMLVVMANLDKPCLLVLDNVNDVNELGRYYDKLRRCDKFHILLTTRITSFELAATYPIPPLDEKHALELFKIHYPGYRNDQDNLLKKICSAVGANTLVLELLAKNFAVINSNSVLYSLDNLLLDLWEKGLIKLEREGKISYADKHNELEHIKIKPSEVLDALYDDKEMVIPLNGKEKCLLSNFSVLPSENIAYVQLKTLLVPSDEPAFSETLTDLAQRGWLQKSKQNDDDGPRYRISPVVQEITRHKNQSQLLEHIRTLINSLIKKLTYDPGRERFVNATDEEAAVYVKYAEFLVNHVTGNDEDLKDLRERIASYDEQTNLDKATASLGRYNQSIQALFDANPKNEILKDELALSYSRLVDAHAALGQFEQAFTFRIKDIELTKELSKANPKDLAIKNELAISYEKAGDTCKALGDMQQASAFFEQNFEVSKELYYAPLQNEDFTNGLAIASEKFREIRIGLGDMDHASRIDKECFRLEKERYDANQQNAVVMKSLADSISQLRQFNWDRMGNKTKATGSVELCYQPEQELKWTRQRQGKILSSVRGFSKN